MTQLGIILILLVRIYTWVLIARIIIEMIQSFSRQFNPPRWFMLIAEPLFGITGPAGQGVAPPDPAPANGWRSA